MLLNHKAFLYKSKDGVYFVVLFAYNEKKEMVCTTFGLDVFESPGFTRVLYEDRTLRYLSYKGHVCVEELPLTRGEEFCSMWKLEVLHWLAFAQLGD